MNNRNDHKDRFALSILSAAIALTPTLAIAQGNSALEEIVVTATKRGNVSVQDLPFSVQAVSGDKLSDMGATGIEDITALVPGFTAFNAGSNQKKLRIRGISSSSESEPQETVGVYLDNAPITGTGGTNNENGASPDINLFDLNRVEVIKGPSGTLYGAGSMGGTVRYILNEPDTEAFYGKIELQASSVEDGDESYSGNLMLNIPVTDDFALRVVAGQRETGGYIDNIVQTGLSDEPKKGPKDDVNSDSVSSFILTGKWAATDKLAITGRYLRQEYEVDAEGSLDADTRIKLDPAYTPPQDNLEQVRFVEETNDDVLDLYTLDIDYDFSSFTLSSNTSYTERSTEDVQDTSIVPIMFFGATAGQIGGSSQLPAPLINDNETEQLTQEFRLSSNSSGPLSWLGGLYYYDLDKTFSQGGAIPGLDEWTGGLTGLFGNPDVPFESLTTQNLEQIAAFGEISYAFSESWSATLGGRWFTIDQDFLQTANGLINGGASVQSGDSSESDFNPKVSVSYHTDSDVHLYGTASKGYRVGGINQPVPLDAGTGCRGELEALGLSAAPGSFDSDSLWNYELGAKMEFNDGKVRLNTAIYYLDWEEVQARKQLECGFTFFDNTAEVEVYGAELDMQWQVTDAIIVTVAAGYNDATLAKDDAFFDGDAGDRVPGVSDVTFSTTARYDFNLFNKQSYVSGDYRYLSEFNSLFNESDPANREAGGFGLLNLRAGIDLTEAWQLIVFVTNATNELEVSGTQSNLFGDYQFVTRPREVGVKTSFRF